MIVNCGIKYFSIVK